MASGILVNIEKEVTCPICLELLKNPMSLDCGHSFCQTCITTNNRESMIILEESSCPVCRMSYELENLHPNRHVANIVEVLREVTLSPQEEQGIYLCRYHGEKLLLFCKEHGKVICWLCERSSEHSGHHTFLMEEIAWLCKYELQEALDTLRAEQVEAEKLIADFKEETTSLKKKRTYVKDYLRQLRGIHNFKKQTELEKLEEEVGDNLESMMFHHIQLLRDLISDLEHRLQGSTVEMLQNVNGIIKRIKNFTPRNPGILSRFPDVRAHITVNLPENNPDDDFSDSDTSDCVWLGGNDIGAIHFSGRRV